VTIGLQPATTSAIGTAQRRFEDHSLLTGRGRFAGDVHLPDMLHLCVVRSDVPHALVRGIDLDEARALSGVVDAFAFADLGDGVPAIPSRVPLSEDLRHYVQFPLARERVRYVGEPVAVIVATDRYVAEDAAGLVRVDYEFLPAIPSVRQALADDAPKLFSGASNLAYSTETGRGDFEQARAEADLIVTETFRVHRHSAVPLETRGLVASFDERAGALSIWGVTKVPHHHQRALGEMLGIAPEKIHFEGTDIGGGFGVRGEFYPEDFLVPIAARRNRHPVQWLEDRREHLLATNHSREMCWDVCAAFAADGTLLGFDVALMVDMGAYLRTIGPWLGLFAADAFVGPYRVPHFHCQLQCVLTNKMGVGSVRSPGGYEATFARERILDIGAETLSIDRVELRKHNFARTSETRSEAAGVPADVTPDHGDYEATLDAVLEALNNGELELLRDASRLRGRQLGIGMACCSEAAYTGELEAARVRYEASGAITVFTGSTSMGQGHLTTLAQIAADALSVEPESVKVVAGDPAMVPDGAGTFGSRTTIMTGNAVWLAAVAARELREEIDSSSDPLRPVEVTREFRTDNTCISHAASVAVVEVDSELGKVFLRRYIVAADVGAIVNPLIVRGQIAGAAVQGIGGALLEELAYSSEAQPLATTFEQYLLPTALDVPTIEVGLVESGAADEGNPLGVRGAGEIGTTGAGAALANAVADAIGGQRRITSLPLKPSSIVAATLAIGEDREDP
jgi:CO/xanthine dehydrogenase Mo-binding subunit